MQMKDQIESTLLRHSLKISLVTIDGAFKQVYTNRINVRTLTGYDTMVL
jgi:hypothetical protein